MESHLSVAGFHDQLRIQATFSWSASREPFHRSEWSSRRSFSGTSATILLKIFLTRKTFTEPVYLNAAAAALAPVATFWRFCRRRPQALHKVEGPDGPSQRASVSVVPHSSHIQRRLEVCMVLKEWESGPEAGGAGVHSAAVMMAARQFEGQSIQYAVKSQITQRKTYV